MKKSQSLPNELLHSFVDGELDVQEHQYVLDEQARDPAVAKEICELRKLKDLVKAARPDDIENTGELNSPKRKHFLLSSKCAALSAFMVLLTALVTGVFLDQEEMRQVENVAATYPDAKTFIVAHQASQSMRVVLHINSSDPDSAKDLFVQLTELLQTTQAKNHSLRVEVIASGPGLSLVRKNKSPYPEKIRDIRNQYDNVLFVACQTTLDRLAKAINKKIQLLPEAMLTASGRDLVRLRKSQGWAYIKI